MPYVQDRRRRYKRRTYSKKRGLASKQNAAHIMPYNSGSRYISRFNPFPAVHNAQLRYTYELDLSHTTSTVVALQKHYFSANSIYKPNASSSIGGQPYGHDQYAALYNHYRVTQSIITMTPIGPWYGTSSATNGGAYGISMEDTTNSDVTLQEVTERKGTTFATCAGSKAGGNQQTITRKYTSSIFPGDGPQSSSASFGSSPSEQFYFGCWMYPIDSDMAVKSKWLVTVTYNVKMWELRDFGSS